MPVTSKTFEQFALENPDRRWELHDGHLREKPPMTFTHNRVAVLLGAQLLGQLDLRRFDLRINAGHVHRPLESYYVPDLFVVPLERTLLRNAEGDTLEVYDAPVLLVVEVWSRSTGGYDVDTKLPAYRARGDREVWRIHPYERTLSAWRRREDGSYEASLHRRGLLTLAALPGVVIDFDALFA